MNHIEKFNGAAAALGLINLVVSIGIIIWLVDITPKQHPGYKPVQCLYMREGSTNLFILMP